MIRNFLRSTPFRVSLLHGLIFIISLIITLLYVYIGASREFKKTLRNQITTETQVLQRIFSGQGAPELMAMMQARSNAPGTGTFLYALVDRHGSEIVGNMPVSMLHEGWNEVAVKSNIVDPEDNGVSELVMFGTRLSNGGLMVVGAGTDQSADLRRILVRSLISSLALVVVLALGGSLLLSRATLARVSAIHNTTRRIMAGDLSQRLTIRGSHDEFDQLSLSINDMLGRIEELMGAMRQVSTDIAHDLRTPLGRLRQRLERAQTGDPTVETCLVALDKAQGETDQILKTFDALLQIGQISALDLRKRFAVVDMSELTGQLVDSYQAVVAEKGQMFSANIAPGLQVRGHRELLAQMLVNLVENAINHCPNGASITLWAGMFDGAVNVRLADNGPGIPPEHRKKIFQPFYRLEQRRKTPGSGLGLALVRSIATLHGIVISLGDNGPGLVIQLTFRNRTDMARLPLNRALAGSVTEETKRVGSKA
ncbi:MAG: HAMP domain-containing sensor histidine kinase [Alphaproteobacteria bacterium]